VLFERCVRDYVSGDGLSGFGRDACRGFGSGRDDGTSPKVAIGPHGKPYFAEPPLAGNVHFSVSHSGRYWAALFADVEVGLDIEELSIHRSLTPERMNGIAERFFAEDERARLAAAAPHDTREMFFRIWTAKEAYVKYTGRGLAEGLASFSSLVAPSGLIITTVVPVADIICSYCYSTTAVSRSVKKNPSPISVQFIE
jgi:phosphopantetheinyl transferase